MNKSESSKQNQNQVIMQWGSAMLSDKLVKLPDELNTIIFSKMEDDPKTLIRCFLVCKNWASLVSQTVNLSIRMSCTGENADSLPCATLHNHIPSSGVPICQYPRQYFHAICDLPICHYPRISMHICQYPGIMKLFANLESLEIKLCHCPSPTPVRPCYQHVTKINVEWAGDDSKTYTCTANEVGLLSTIQGPLVSLELEREKFDTIEDSSALDLYWTVLYYRPETMRSLVIVSAKMNRLRSEGKVFISYDQLSEFPESISKLRLNKSWLENPKNVVYWHKNQRRKKRNSLQEKVWLFYQWQSLMSNEGLNMTDLIERKEDLMKLLDGLADGDSGKGKPRSQFRK
ncbi:hypothetical protein SADUNF_Sadunf01G0019500 [Salix dunnii]|uniref:F-box domain-containing protein n=1 Tax=Salix dunnii TaxID=1413687 RepID=A0A835TIK3_9ROSI|nr:hypothetical protein SADUNF_Sadunf01G0019500 [Salix dunnii]